MQAKYKKLFTDIQEKIISGEWFNKMLMPTEYELCKLYGVSRITVRRAMSDLEEIGLISKVQGKGTFVSHEIVRSGENWQGFSDHMYELGYSVQTRLLKKEIISASNDIIMKLKMDHEDSKKVWHFTRVRLVDNKPVAVMNSYIREGIGNLMDKYDLENEAFYNLFEKITGKKVAYADSTVTAIIPNMVICKLLSVKNGSAHIFYKSIGYLTDKTPIEVNYSVFNANYYEFSVNLNNAKYLPLY